VRTVRLEPMTPADFVPWSRHSVRGFAAQQVAAGLAAEREASAFAAEVFAATLPDGLATPSHRLWTVHADGDLPVGSLWLQARPGPDGVVAYLFEVEIVPEARGRGLGRAAMLAVEAEARALGATALRLNVFGHNTPAMALYDALGYAVERATFVKRLPRRRPGGPLQGSGSRPAPGAERGVELREMSREEYAEARPALGAAVTDGPDRLLPHGPATGGQRLWVAEAGGSVVGRAWMSLQHRPGGSLDPGVHGLLRDLEVSPDLRGQGYGRSTLRAVERAAQDLGAVTLTVEVTDAAARGLLTGGGFVLTAQTMTKAL
jgi:ribosomal protein S18 acetylase RimI-like enzyme